MSLSSAYDGAIAGLSSASAQIALVSRNIANQSNPSATRKIANIVTVNGLPTVASISRVSSSALLSSLLSANAANGEQSAISTALTQLQTTLGTSGNSSNAPVALLGQLNDALQTYAASPQNSAAAQSAVVAAQNLANGLNSASATVESVRNQADAGIASSVTSINNLLNQFGQVNATIVTGTVSGADVTDAMDQRDSILQQLSQQIGITTVTRANNDVAIFTDSGVTLFDKTARSVTFTPTAFLTPGTPGNAVYADGVPITDQGSSLSIHSGALVGLVNVRDNLAVTYQTQLDEMARGLITDFQETDQSGSATPQAPQAGLFTDGVDLNVPPAGTAVPGLAASIQVASTVDPTTGNPSLLRDGGISTNGAGSVYVYNPTPGQTGYSARLNQLISNLSQSIAFDPTAGAGTNESVSDFASASASWLGTQVSQATAAASYSAALQSSATNALSNTTGVNLDTEMSNMLALEQSYQASAKLLDSINSMYTALFAAI
ncbi:MAG: flagellar hook-associated protein FlgK [Rhodomicrobium sp.]